jgi:hypothetical protein
MYFVESILPMSPEHHLTPALPHFMAERETNSFRILRSLLAMAIFSTK